MAVYVYRGITKQGQLIKNKVEEASKLKLIKRLKSNGIIPIEIVQTAYKKNGAVRQKKRNTTDIEEIMKNVNTTKINKSEKRTRRKNESRPNKKF